MLEPLFSEFEDILSSPKSFDTRTMHLAEVYAREIAAGTFYDSHRWEPAWARKYTRGRVAPYLEVCVPDDAVAKIRAALLYVRLKAAKGSWYPPVKNGKRTKVSLTRFLVENSPAGDTSPFLEHFILSNKAPLADVDEARRQLGPKVTLIVEEVLAKAKDVDMALFWGGALKLLEWWQSLPDSVVDSNPQSQLMLSKASSLFRAVADYQSSGGWVPKSFVSPVSPSWGQFKAWALRTRKVAL